MKKFIVLFVIFNLMGCAEMFQERNDFLDSEQTQLQLRQMQSRSFDTKDLVEVQRAVISTLQDLGFVMNRVDADLGVVSATKLDGYHLVMSVTSRLSPQKRQVSVRANANYQTTPIVDPLFYQTFFNALQKSLFLTANNID